MSKFTHATSTIVPTSLQALINVNINYEIRRGTPHTKDMVTLQGAECPRWTFTMSRRATEIEIQHGGMAPTYQYHESFVVDKTRNRMIAGSTVDGKFPVKVSTVFEQQGPTQTKVTSQIECVSAPELLHQEMRRKFQIGFNERRQTELKTCHMLNL